MRALLVVLCLPGCRAEPDEDSGKSPSDSPTPTWFVDADEDGFGDPAVPADEESASAVEDGSDCDDRDATIHPGADESCDGVDQDCDGEPDEGVTVTVFPDGDADGFGSATASEQACGVADGWTFDANDCDDADAAVNPDADEICNDRDDDCDGATDDDDDALTGATNWYLDADGDGYGAASTEPMPSCIGPEGWVVATGDCNDADAAIRPEWGLDDMDCDGQPGLSVGAARTTVRGRFDGDGVGQYLAVADADGDGLADAYVRGEGGTLGYGAVWVIGGAQLAAGGMSDTSDAIAELRGESENSGFGIAPRLIEDRDGDGLAELLCWSYDGTAYFTSATLLSANSFSDATGIITLEDELGAAAIGLVPDLDDDGEQEVLFAGSVDAGGVDNGRVYFVPASLLDTGGELGDATTTITGEYRSATGSESRVVDLDGDGVVEVLVSAQNDTAIDTTGGAIYTFRASTLSGGGAFQTSDADAALGTHRPGGYLGFQMQALDDVDGDGTVDVVVLGAVGSGDDEYWLIGGSGLLTGGLAEELAVATWQGQEDNHTDYAVANAGDVDGDGRADLLTGSSFAGPVPADEYAGTGRAYLYLGSRIAAGGTMRILDDADAVFTGDDTYQAVGFSVAGAGDVDGDGRDDILIGAPGEDSGELRGAGALHLLTSTF